jgi:hypothetical protein
LIEEQRTNLLPYSEQFDNAVWSKRGNSSVVLSDVLAPDGTLTATKITGSSAGAAHVVEPNAASDGDIKSIYIRTVTGTGTIGSLTSASTLSTLFEINKEWQRIEYPGGDSNADVNFYVVDFRGSTLTEVIVWGAQLEQGSFPTSYIPTVGTQVTRAADNCVRVLGDEYNQDEGTIYLEIPSGARNSNIPRLLFFKPINGSSFSEVFGFNIVATGYLFAGRSAENSAISSSIDAGSDSVIKLAASYKIGGDYVFAVNGQTTSGSWLTVAPLVEEIGIGNRENGHPNIAIKDFQVFPTALSEAELITLTTGN